jgi:LysM repeat protein
MHIQQNYKRLILFILLVSVVPGTACNFPFPTSSSSQAADLQQTLTALAPLLTDEATPIPGTREYGEINSENATPVPNPASFRKPEPPHLDPEGNFYVYHAMAGDTLPAVAKRFGVEAGQITSPETLTGTGWLSPQQVLVIPNVLGEPRHTDILLPDSEVVYSPSAQDFNINEFVQAAGGYLREHEERVNGKWMSGADIVKKVSMENSINPRILLAMLELRSGWVFGAQGGSEKVDYPIGFGWRSGEKVSLSFQDGGWLRMAPGINPGSAALQTVLSKFMTQVEWRSTLFGDNRFTDLYAAMFGDSWNRASESEPLLPLELVQPELLLPFAPGERWSFTGGPHRSWNAGSPRGALDFSPVTGEPACTTSRAWVTASAQGIITRAIDNVVAIDLDGDGREQTGWVLVYLHIVPGDDIQAGRAVEADDPLGHPSCERGNSTGTHIHIARKYNGEWLPAGEPLPFILSGWETQMGERNYQGDLKKGDQTISANPGGPSSSLIIREE